MDSNQVVCCAFCGGRRIPEITKPGMMTPLTQDIPIAVDDFGRGMRIVVDISPPVICYDCILRFADQIRDEQNSNVDLLLKDGSRIIFDGDRWYIIEENDKKSEVFRSYALNTLAANGLKRQVSEKAWKDACQPDQPLLPIEADKENHLEIKFQGQTDRLFFIDRRWYLDGGPNRYKEVTRSSAKRLLVQYGTCKPLPEYALQDLEEPDQDLLPLK